MNEDELQQLVERLAQAELALGAVVADQVDAIVYPDGQAYLLRSAQQALVDSEQRANAHADMLDALLASAPDVIEYVDESHKVLFANRVLADYGRDGIIGADWLALVGPELRIPLATVLESVLASGQPASHESHHHRPSGDAVWYSRRFGPLRRDGKVVGVVIITKDITASRQAEAQLIVSDRMASVGTLAAGIAHEINNPLAALIANLDLIAEMIGSRDVPLELRELLADASGAADRVRTIVRDLKIFSRIDADTRGDVDVEQVLETTLQMARNEIRHRATLVKQYAGVARVEGNEGRLGQVFLNLVVNAAQAIPEGNAHDNFIRISTAQHDGRVVITVADTGAGIPAEVQRRMFTPFYTTKPIGTGTGLGLAICQRIVTALGGEITFESTVGAGTTFHVALPVARHTRPLPVIAAVEDNRTPRRGRILVIDDEPAIANGVARILATHHDVVAVDRCARALALLEQGDRFDVIVCDLMMPEMTGMTFHAEIAARFPSLVASIVFMTGGAFTESARAFFEALKNPWIEKPFSSRDLRALINRLVR